jgi:hypothetical protein
MAFFYARWSADAFFFDTGTKNKATKKKSFTGLLFGNNEKASKKPTHYYSKFAAKLNS